jgi:hypothetical protein
LTGAAFAPICVGAVDNLRQGVDNPENLWITYVRHARDLVTFITWLERLTSWNYWQVISLCQWILVQYSYSTNER